MTIEQLLECSADQLEAMSDAELIQYLSPYFEVTRPQPTKQKQEGTPAKVTVEQKLKIRQAELIAKQFGLDLKGIFK